jgi:hypoxanthine phosphoribosyltransferase
MLIVKLAYLCGKSQKPVSMKQVDLLDKSFEIFIANEQIQKAIDQMAEPMAQDLRDKNPLFLVVLNGAFMFAADLLKRFDFDCQVSFVKLSSYMGTKTTSVVREIIGLDEVLHGRTVVIVEDIIDTGITMANTIPKLRNLEAKEVKLASLLFKPDAFTMDYPIDYIGLKIPNDFIVGYGLDYNGYGRNLPDIYKLKS